MKLRHLVLSISTTLVTTSFIALAPAGAGGAEPVSVMVRHADLDLRTSEGAARLEARIARAARKVCVQPGHSLDDLAFERKCRREALTNARADAARLVARALEKQSDS